MLRWQKQRERSRTTRGLHGDHPAVRAFADLQVAQRIAEIGSWSWDPATDVTTWSAEMYRLFDRDPADGPARGEEMLIRVHPDDREALLAAYTAVLEGGDTFGADFRIVRRDGSERTVHARGLADPVDHRFLGTVQDLTDLRAVERQLRASREELRRQSELLRERDRQLSEAHALAHLGDWEWALDDSRAVWSDEVCRIFGVPLGFRPTFEQFIALIHPEDRARIERQATEHDPAAASDSRCRITRPGGEVRHIHMRRFRRLDSRGRPSSLFGTVQDVTEATLAAAELMRAREYSEAIVAAMSEGYALTVDGEITAVNEAVTTLTGFAREELLGTRAPFPFWPEDRLAQIEQVRKRIVAAEGGTFELELCRRNGSRFDAEITAVPARNSDGSLIGFVNTFRDVSEQRRHQRELERLARHDALTGLPNRRLFLEQLAAEIARAERSGRHPSVVILDIDHFKQINDHHGHPAGDAVLAEVACRLSALCREGELVARIGGEEFAWILHGTDTEGALSAAQRARWSIAAAPISPAGRVTLSAGVCAHSPGVPLEELYSRADAALYEAKRGGRDRALPYVSARARLATPHPDRPSAVPA